MSSSRSTLQQTALETAAILHQGVYACAGRTVTVRAAVARAVRESTGHAPEDFPAIEAECSRLLTETPRVATAVDVTNESSLAAAWRLVQQGEAPVVLNFASAKNPGGGWLAGARAQEESLARASALVPTLDEHPAGYAHNRYDANGALYSDHMIWSPRVPVFRGADEALLTAPYELTFLTSAAPNAGAVHDNHPARACEIEPVFRQRLSRVLALARVNGTRCLVLGAWGCGAFRNDPRLVARLFAEALLADGRFAGAFARIVFAILDHGSETNIGPFREALAARG